MTTIQKVCYEVLCFVLSLFVPMMIFCLIEQKKRNAFILQIETQSLLNELDREDDSEEKTVAIKAIIVSNAEKVIDIEKEVEEITMVYVRLKKWELGIEIPIQSIITIIFTFMKTSLTTLSSIFQNWFVSNNSNLIILVLMSLRSIIFVQVFEESARKKQFLGMKSKALLIPIYILASISRVVAIVLFLSIPLGLFSLLGHHTVEREGLPYQEWDQVQIDKVIIFNV